MFDRLRQRWGISTLRVLLVLITFAAGGSLCGWAARKLMLLMDVPNGIIWWVLYLLLVTVLWPVAVMLISLLTGQFSFFKSYLSRMAHRMGFGTKERTAAKSSDTV